VLVFGSDYMINVSLAARILFLKNIGLPFLYMGAIGTDIQDVSLPALLKAELNSGRQSFSRTLKETRKKSNF
jgi:hypothetical protein